jgi:chitin disaccharide deacetylase
MRDMKRELIINADDLGADLGRNAGIFEAIQGGAVSSVSVLANGPAIEDALERLHSLKQPRISIGVHLNLSEGKPLSLGLRLLTGPDGHFPGKASTQRLLVDSGNTPLEREVAREISAQIEACKKAGLTITHFDGHQHVHIFPAVFPGAVKIAREHKIPWMRVPEEFIFFSGGDLPAQIREEALAFSRLAGVARGRLGETGIQTTEHFFGLSLKGRITPPVLAETLQHLRPGLTELMVHPGRVYYNDPSNPFSAFSTADRERELAALLAPEFRLALTAAGIHLVCFGDRGT